MRNVYSLCPYMSEWEKEKYVHDFICQNVHYDKLKKAYSHEISGPLGDQEKGICIVLIFIML